MKRHLIYRRVINEHPSGDIRIALELLAAPVRGFLLETWPNKNHHALHFSTKAKRFSVGSAHKIY